jgi:hypothetical protein
MDDKTLGLILVKIPNIWVDDWAEQEDEGYFPPPDPKQEYPRPFIENDRVVVEVKECGRESGYVYYIRQLTLDEFVDRKIREYLEKLTINIGD